MKLFCKASIIFILILLSSNLFVLAELPKDISNEDTSDQEESTTFTFDNDLERPYVINGVSLYGMKGTKVTSNKKTGELLCTGVCTKLKLPEGSLDGLDSGRFEYVKIGRDIEQVGQESVTRIEGTAKESTRFEFGGKRFSMNAGDNFVYTKDKKTGNEVLEVTPKEEKKEAEEKPKSGEIKVEETTTDEKNPSSCVNIGSNDACGKIKASFDKDGKLVDVRLGNEESSLEVGDVKLFGSKSGAVDVMFGAVECSDTNCVNARSAEEQFMVVGKDFVLMDNSGFSVKFENGMPVAGSVSLPEDMKELGDFDIMWKEAVNEYSLFSENGELVVCDVDGNCQDIREITEGIIPGPESMNLLEERHKRLLTQEPVGGEETIVTDFEKQIAFADRLSMEISALKLKQEYKGLFKNAKEEYEQQIREGQIKNKEGQIKSIIEQISPSLSKLDEESLSALRKQIYDVKLSDPTDTFAELYYGTLTEISAKKNLEEYGITPLGDILAIQKSRLACEDSNNIIDCRNSLGSLLDISKNDKDMDLQKKFYLDKLYYNSLRDAFYIAGKSERDKSFSERINDPGKWKEYLGGLWGQLTGVQKITAEEQMNRLYELGLYRLNVMENMESVMVEEGWTIDDILKTLDTTDPDYELKRKLLSDWLTVSNQKISSKQFDLLPKNSWYEDCVKSSLCDPLNAVGVLPIGVLNRLRMVKDANKLGASIVAQKVIREGKAVGRVPAMNIVDVSRATQVAEESRKVRELAKVMSELTTAGKLPKSLSLQDYKATLLRSKRLKDDGLLSNEISKALDADLVEYNAILQEEGQSVANEYLQKRLLQMSKDPEKIKSVTFATYLQNMQNTILDQNGNRQTIKKILDEFEQRKNVMVQVGQASKTYEASTNELKKLAESAPASQKGIFDPNNVPKKINILERFGYKEYNNGQKFNFPRIGVNEVYERNGKYYTIDWSHGKKAYIDPMTGQKIDLPSVDLQEGFRTGGGFNQITENTHMNIKWEDIGFIPVSP